MLEPSFLVGQVLSGLTAAMFLFVVASGLSVVFGVLRVLNFAHGSFYMMGAYLAWQMMQWLGPVTGNFWLAVLGAALGVALLGGLVERFLLRRLYGKEDLYQLLLTYALVLILGDAARIVWGTQQLSVPRPAGLDRELRGPRRHRAVLQLLHHPARPADRGDVLAASDAHRHSAA